MTGQTLDVMAPGAAPPALETQAKPEAFTFGDPIPVLDRPWFLDYLECGTYGKYYEPPISWEGLTRSFRAAPHHPSAMQVKVNILTSTFVPHKLLTRSAFQRLALDFLMFGNAYLERKDNRLGQPLSLEPALAKFTRRGIDLTSYYYVAKWGQEHLFENEVFHLLQPDVSQEIYGLPEYLAALPSVWLNESATLFRRKYYLNGSHAGFILYVSDPASSQEDIDNMRKELKSAKGVGNFRNLFYYSPNGSKDGIKVIPISEVAAKDEFAGMKNVTRDDQLAAHRVPPQMMGIIPNNSGGFGDAESASRVFQRNEILPLQNRFKELNDWLGQNVITFEKYSLIE